MQLKQDMVKVHVLVRHEMAVLDSTKSCIVTIARHAYVKTWLLLFLMNNNYYKIVLIIVNLNFIRWPKQFVKLSDEESCLRKSNTLSPMRDYT